MSAAATSRSGHKGHSPTCSRTVQDRKLRAVNRYSRAGWPLVLCNGKGPVDKDWPNTPLACEEIGKRLESRPELNPAVILGPESGIVDFECDSPEAEVGLQDLFNGKVPATATFRSRRGRHYLFQWAAEFEGIGKAVIHYEKLEIRLGPGACTVLPPGETQGYKRRWVRHPNTTPPTEVPKRVVKKLVEAFRKSASRNSEPDPGDVIPKGERNDCLTRLAGKMRFAGMDLEEIGPALRAVNKNRCMPPLPEREVKAIAASIARYPAGSLNSFNSFNSFNSYAADWPELGTAALSGLAGEIVGAIDSYTEADRVATLAHLLIPFGVVVGSGPHCMVQHDRHPARTNALLVGDTSKGRKGTSWSSCRELYYEVDKRWAENQVLSGLSTGEGIIHHLSDDREMEDKRALILEQEFVNTLAVISRPENTLSGTIRQAFDTGTLRVLTRTNPLAATNTHIGIIGHITQEELQRRLTAIQIANGFANRFLFLLVRRSKLLPDGATPDPAMMHRLAVQLRMSVAFSRKANLVVRDAAASELWHEVYEPLSEGKPGLAGAATSRAEVHVLRLSLTYALLDRSKVITPEHLRAALAVWEYADASARLIFDRATGDPLADRIYGLLVGEPKSTTQISHDLGRNYSSKDIQLALKLLISHRLVGKDKEKTKGAPKQLYRRVTN